MKFKIQGMVLALCAMPIIAVLLFAFSSGAISGKTSEFGTVPSFRLTDQDEQSVDRADLIGKVWVANFIFTSCAGICPMLNQKMEKLVEEFGADPHFKAVSFTVDPEKDTPRVLKTYSEKFNTKGDRWSFLTGSRPELKDLLQNGFKVVMGGMEGASTGMITHSETFVLVDRQGRIRKYLDMSGEDPDQMVEARRSIYKYLGKRF